jgi:competence protein ComGC
MGPKTPPWKYLSMCEVKSRRPAATLIETLVVLGIFALLLALLLPAVQKVRAAAARSVCRGNLKQLALAAHNYESVHGVLPPGNLAPTKSLWGVYGQSQYTGVFVFLLPYLERDAEYSAVAADPILVDFQRDARPWWLAPDGKTPNRKILEVAATRMNIVNCPTVPEPADLEYYGGYAYATRPPSTERHVFSPLPARDGGYARSHYAGVAGAGANPTGMFAAYRGPLAGRSRTALVHIADGTANTLLFGELVGTINLHFAATAPGAFCWFAAPGMVTTNGLSPDRDAKLVQFSTHHPGGVGFANADGSVRELSLPDSHRVTTPNWWLLQRLAAIADGGSTSVD